MKSEMFSNSEDYRLSVAPMMERTETYLESIACECTCAGFVHTPW